MKLLLNDNKLDGIVEVLYNNIIYKISLDEKYLIKTEFFKNFSESYKGVLFKQEEVNKILSAKDWAYIYSSKTNFVQLLKLRQILGDIIFEKIITKKTPSIWNQDIFNICSFLFLKTLYSLLEKKVNVYILKNIFDLNTELFDDLTFEEVLKVTSCAYSNILLTLEIDKYINIE